jgi:hypothetical protein
MSDKVKIMADMECNADQFWDNFREQFPVLAIEFDYANVVTVDRETWSKIQMAPGFCEGPEYAREALIEVQS